MHELEPFIAGQAFPDSGKLPVQVVFESTNGKIVVHLYSHLAKIFNELIEL